MRPIILEVSSDRGDSIAIQADDLTLLTDAELMTLRMSRADLQRCFAEGLKLMEGTTERDRVRPCADETADGEWIVTLVHYFGAQRSAHAGSGAGQGVAYPQGNADQAIRPLEADEGPARSASRTK
jgi:hypothetical protein